MKRRVFVPKKPDAVRRRTMQAVKSKNTKLELMIRSLVHRAGYRFRIHRKDLPGRPDIVLVSRKKVVFVHGCFWHGHNCNRKGMQIPKTNRRYWEPKLKRNRERDVSNRRKLIRMGWRVFVVRECQTKPKKIERLKTRLFDFLES